MRKAIKIILAAALFISLATGIVICYPQNEVMAESAAAFRTPLADAADTGEDVYVFDEEAEGDITPDENEGGTQRGLASEENEKGTPTENESEASDQNANAGGAADPDKNADDSLHGSSKNGFEQIYNTVMMHISEILSLAAFIGSLICAIIYKSGLMPLVNNGLLGLKNAVVKIKEATDKAEVDNKESVDGISRRIEELEGAIADMGEAFTSLREALSGLEDQKAHRMRLDTILEGELDMLYDIFMTSSLPEYEKARVGERMTKLKGVLNSGEGEK